MDDFSTLIRRFREHALPRRDFIRITGAAGLATVFGSVLAACGDDDDDDGDDEEPTSAAGEPTTAAGEPTATGDGGGAAGTATSAPQPGGATPTSTAIGGLASPTGDAEPQQGGTMRIGISTNLETADPHKARTGVQTIYANFLSDALVRFNAFGELQPKLAASWEVAEDGLTYDFTLVEGAIFHDGETFDAEAAKFNFDRLLDPEFGAFLREPLPKITSVEALDPATLRFVLSVNSALFVPNLTWANLCMVSPAAVEAAGDTFGDNPIGLGPFKFVSYTPDQEVELERYDDYWNGTPYLDGITMRVIPEDSTRLIEFEDGGLEVNTLIQSSEIERLREDFVIVEGARFSFAWLAMSFKNPLFQELKMRQAFAHAIDRQTLIDEVFYGLADLGEAGIPPATWGFDPNIKGPEYDPEAAGALLDELGWVMGDDGIRTKDGNQLKVVLRAWTGSDLQLQTQIVQQFLKDVGIDSEIENSEPGAAYEAIRSENYDVCVWSLGGIGDAHPGEYAGSFRTDYYWNPSRHNIAELDAVIDELQVAHDMEQAKQLASQYQQLMIEHQPTAWLHHTGRNFAMQKSVQGAEVSSDALIHLNTAWIAEE